MDPEPARGTAWLESRNAGTARSARVGPGRVVALLLAITLISHMNRISISTAGDSRIMSQYGIAPTSMGWVYSAFLITYTACMIPGGLVIDRFGPRAALMIVLFGSSAFAALTGLVGFTLHSAGSVLVGLWTVRGLMGILSAPLHPACARAVGQWVPPRSRSWANGLVNGAALVGIAATPPGFGELIARFDWPASFLVLAGLTAAVGLVWTLGAADRPVNGEGGQSLGELLAPASWRPLLRHRGLLFLTLSYGMVGYFQYMFFYWMSYYFETVLKLSISTSHFYAAIPPLAMAVGMPLGGWLSDRLEHRRGAAGARKLVPVAGLFAGAVLLIGGVTASEPAWIVAWFSLALGAVGMSEGPYWATAVELGGRRAGSAAALLNFGGNAIGLLAPVVTPWVGQHLNWGYAVALGALSCLIAVALWFAISLDAVPDAADR